MNETTNPLPCSCTHCPGASCTCGCQQPAAPSTAPAATPTACPCGPQCACGPGCRCVRS